MQQEKTMRKSTRLALGFAALAGLVATAAYAADGPRGWGVHGMYGNMRLHHADADKSGDITFDEFSAAMKGRMENADANHDGKVTVEELAAYLEKARYERMARRMIGRFDTNGDGELTEDEVQGRQKKLFALMDRNDDGKIEEAVMPRHHGRRGGWGHQGPNGGDVE